MQSKSWNTVDINDYVFEFNGKFIKVFYEGQEVYRFNADVHNRRELEEIAMWFMHENNLV